MASLAPPDPPLSTSHVALRPWVAADVDQLVSACQDRDIHTYLPIPDPYTPDDAAAYIERTRLQWADGSKAAFAIVPPGDDRRLLGAISMAIAGGVGNAGYWVVSTARGRGVASGSLGLVTDWGFGALGLGVVLLEIRPQNVGSIRVAEAAGYHRAGSLDVPATGGIRAALLYVRLVADGGPDLTRSEPVG